MKIGILTYHRSRNYGALLQAYAQQEFLRNNGYDAVMIDYWPLYHKRMYRLFDWSKFCSLTVRSKVKYLYTILFTFVRHFIRRSNTNFFVNNYLHLDNSMKYDVASYGSDQIWRKQDYPDVRRYNPVYFADDSISAKKKIAFAGSMGKIEVDNAEDRAYLKKLWENFDAISVREKDLQGLIFDINGIHTEHVLDPVFLLSKDQWGAILHNRRYHLPKKKYIVYYRLQRIKAADDFVKRIAEEKNLDVYEFSGYLRPFTYSKRYKETASVLELIFLLANAEFVVSAAFHGLAMSICYERQFYAFSDKAQSNRLASLLDMIGLSDRLNPAPDIDINDNINYVSVNEILEPLREKSRKWLLDNISL